MAPAHCLPCFMQLHRFVSSTSEANRLVILGTGWASYSALKTVNRNQFQRIVISPRNHFLFTPLLCSTSVGTLEFRSIIEPVRNIGFRKTDHFHLCHVRSADLVNKTVRCRSVIDKTVEYDVPYDILVIGVGALPSTFGIPGVNEHAYFLKEVADARRIRNRILDNFELSVQLQKSNPTESRRLLHTVIVGGGPTGIEFGAELYDFVKEDVSRKYKTMVSDVKVTLLDAHKILATFDPRLQSYAEKQIKTRKNFSLRKSSVIAVHDDHVVLDGGERLYCGMVVWSTGLAPRDFTRELNVEKNSRGQIITDNKCRVKGFSDIYAIGDCADVQDAVLPCTAQVAERQGRYVGRLLNGEIRNSFEFHSRGMLAYLGDYKALSDTPAFQLEGFTSWFLWRSAYLTRLGNWRLRMQVPVDWTKALLFGRDISRF